MRTRAKILVLAFAVALPHTLADEAQRWKGASEAVKQAALARQQGDPARATRILEAALAACGRDARCQAVAELGLGLNARATGSLELALAHYQKALRLQLQANHTCL